MTITTIVSAVIGVVAIIVALRANDRVKRSEEKALTRADRERRTLFDFEILRDLLAQLDDNATYAFVKHVGSSMEQKVGARLAMLPADSLPVWRGLKSATTRLDIVAKYRAAARPADPQLFDRQIDAYINGSGSPPLELVSAVREALRVDIQEAVAERMESLRAVG